MQRLRWLLALAVLQSCLSEAQPATAPGGIDALAPVSTDSMAAQFEEPGPDVQRDIRSPSLPDAGSPAGNSTTHDAREPAAPPAEDVGEDDAAIEADVEMASGVAAPVAEPSASCAVTSMVDAYTGLLPPNPFEPFPPIPDCPATGYNAILVLGCPTNPDGTPSACQEPRGDLAVALAA